MVREKHVFLGNPGAGKTTLINCLVGEAKLKTDGHTDKYQNVEHGDILYMDTPGLANEQIVKQAAEQITTALQQGGAYKLFFLVRLQSGRVVSEDITTLERVLDAIKIDDLRNKYTIVINNITPIVYQQLAELGDAFKTVKEAVNRKYSTDSFCLVAQIEELKEAVNGVARLPQSVYDHMNNAPAIRIESRQVEPIDVSGMQQRIAKLERELAKALEMIARLEGGASASSSNQRTGPRPRKDHTSQEPGSPTSGYQAIDLTSRTIATRKSNCCSKKLVALIVALLLVGTGVAVGVLKFTHKSDSKDQSTVEIQPPPAVTVPPPPTMTRTPAPRTTAPTEPPTTPTLSNATSPATRAPATTEPPTAPPTTQVPTTTLPPVTTPPPKATALDVGRLLPTNRCFSVNVAGEWAGEWVVCFDTGTATQSMIDHGDRSLGTMLPYDTVSRPSSVKFTDGDPAGCTGPRSLVLNLKCAADYALTDPTEPSVCAYAATFKSPGACDLSRSGARALRISW